MSVPKLRFKADDGSEFPEWEEWCLGDICDIKTGPFGSTLHASDYVENGTPIVTTEHFKNGSLPITKQGIPQVGDRDIHKLSSYSLQQGDIVFSRVGSIDVNALVTPTQKGWLFSGRVLRVRPSEDINCVYLHYELLTARVRKNITDRAVGQTMPSLNTDILKKTQVFMPSGCEQQKIAVCLSVIDNVIDQTQSEIDAWEKQKRGVMQLLFSQKLRFKADDGSELPEWEEKRLKEVCDIIGGGTPSTKQRKFWNGDVLWISSSDVKENDVQYINKNRYITQEAIDHSATKRIPAGSVLIVSRVGVGKVVLTDEELCTSQDFTNMIDISEEPLFIAYCMSNRMQQEAASVQGTAIKGIPSKEIQEYALQLPCHEEQKKIAACLSAFDDVIDKTKKELDAYRELKKGLLQQMFV